MLTRKEFMPIEYYKKEAFTGSMQGMRYMLRKKETEENKFLEVIVWPQPFCFEKTPDEQKNSAEFSFNEDGICEAIDWLNAQYEERKDEYKEAALKLGI